jgi:hypothetical protein
MDRRKQAVVKYIIRDKTSWNKPLNYYPLIPSSAHKFTVSMLRLVNRKSIKTFLLYTIRRKLYRISDIMRYCSENWSGFNL